MKREEVFRMLDDIARGIALTFGENCETLIQDYGQPNHPILAIYNGHVSGRSVGSELEIASGASRFVPGVELTGHLINCLAVRDEKRLKSTSFNFRGDDYVFCLGINFDFTVLSQAQAVLESLNTVSEAINVVVDQNMLGHIFDNAVRQIGVAPENMNRTERLELISLLQNQNAFTFQKSVPYVADRLGVSRFTIYSYIRELSGES